MAAKTGSKTLTPEAQLRIYLDRFGPKEQKLFRSVRAAMRKRFPSANELAYDYGTHIVISYTATDHAIEAVGAIAARDDGVRLYLMQGPKLPDPKGLLLGSGGQTRYLTVESVSQLAQPDVKALIDAAAERAIAPLKSKGKGTLIIRPTTASKRARPKSKK